jgi:hypothetical protein
VFKRNRYTWIVLITLCVALVFAFDLTPWVRGGFGWRWQYAPVPLVRALPLIALMLLYIAGGWLLLTRTRRARWMLLWALVGTAALSFAVAYAREGDALYFLFTRTASIVASAEWWGAAQVDWSGGGWRDWLAVMRDLGQTTSNMATSPPGMPMLYALAADLFGRVPAAGDALYRGLLPYQCHNFDLLMLSPAQWGAAWVGMLSPVWAGLAVFPIYTIARRVAPHGDARIPVFWWALVPGILAFATSSSTLFPVIALWVMDWLMRGLSGRRAWLIAAGTLYSVGMFLNFIFLPLAALYGFYTLLYFWFVERPRGVHWTRPIIVGVWFGIGAALPWLVFYGATGQTFFQMLTASLNTHLDLERPYAYWVWMHVWDWAVWTGLAFVLLALLGKRAAHRDPINNVLPLALLLTVLAFTLSGTTRGESGRIWLVLSPFALIAFSRQPSAVSREDKTRADTQVRPYSAQPVSPSSARAFPFPLSTFHFSLPFPQPFFPLSTFHFPLLFTQACFTLILVLCLDVYNAPDLTPPPTPQAVSTSQPVDAVFSTRDGDGYRLTGWDAHVEGDTLTLNLAWAGITRPTQPQWFSAILVAPDGTTYPVEAWQPSSAIAGVDYPTTCWAAGMQVGDSVSLPLPPAAVSGDWYISLAAFGGGALADERLTVTLPDGAQDGQIGLGPVRVGTSPD